MIKRSCKYRKLLQTLDVKLALVDIENWGSVVVQRSGISGNVSQSTSPEQSFQRSLSDGRYSAVLSFT